MRKGTAAVGVLTALMCGGVSYAADPIDRLQTPQRVLVEIFHMPGARRLEVEHRIKGRLISLASLFAPGGIRIEVRYRDLPAHVPVPERFNYETSGPYGNLVRSASTPDQWTAAIFVATRDADNPDWLSYLPDMESRGVVVVFAEPHGSGAVGMFLSAAHELTHVFNLHHADWEGKSFQEGSTVEGYSMVDTVLWRLSKASILHLRHQPDEWVRPGGSVFGVVNPEHAARHQKIPSEIFSVQTAPEMVLAAVTLDASSPGNSTQLGPQILIGDDLGETGGLVTVRDSARIDVSVKASGADLTEIRVVVQSGSNTQDVRHLRSPNSKKQRLSNKIDLTLGENTIRVTAVDAEGRRTEESLMITREEIAPKMLAVVIGVQDYTQVPPLKYALADARAVRDKLIELGLQNDDSHLFYRENPNLRMLRQGLGTWLRRNAKPHDIAIVYYAGHGAASSDESSADKDTMSKYLLPVEAEMNDLYSTALPMKELAGILADSKADTTLFFLDACFSGAAGGRAVATPGERLAAQLDNAFLKPMFGAGRLIISASGANEPASERDDLGNGHGVFTYYLLQGLAGSADLKNDGTVDHLELYTWVLDQVRTATGARQNPGLFGEVNYPVPLYQRGKK